ncbi:MAG: hypothetical protein ACSHWU_03655 [Marinicella sp.]
MPDINNNNPSTLSKDLDSHLPDKTQAATNTGWVNTLTDVLSFVFFTVVCTGFFWLIVDEQSRASLEFGLSPAVVIFLSICLIIFVGILEGSQIAIINLEEKHHSKFCEKKHHTQAIKKIIHTKQAIHHYLIGRQLLVVVSVIVFSLLTSFPHIEATQFGIQIPAVVDLFVFKLGLVNALILLWFGQLIPQLIAHRAPQVLLNFWAVKQVIKLCIFFSHLKIAKPSSEVANLVEEEPREADISQTPSNKE